MKILRYRSLEEIPNYYKKKCSNRHDKLPTFYANIN